MARICCSATMSVISMAYESASVVLFIIDTGGHSRDKVWEPGREEGGEGGGGGGGERVRLFTAW